MRSYEPNVTTEFTQVVDLSTLPFVPSTISIDNTSAAKLEIVNGPDSANANKIVVLSSMTKTFSGKNIFGKLFIKGSQAAATGVIITLW